MDFTFGIITDGKSDALIHKIIESISNQNVPKYEIIIVGNTNITTSANTKIIPFDENVKRAWITKKKNIIAQNATCDNIVFIHDYVSFCEGWYNGFLNFFNEFGDFDIISNKILNFDGKRFRDWNLFPGDHKYPTSKQISTVLNKTALLPYHIKSNEKINTHIYFSGAFFIVKRSLILKYPLDEKLAWGEGEDVYWCKYISKFYTFKFNAYSHVKLLKQKPNAPWENEISEENLKLLFGT